MSEEIIKLTIQEDSPISISQDEYIKGDKGDAATVKVGKVTTGEPNSNASVVNSGTVHDAVLDFNIPKGATGRAATVKVGTITTGKEGTSPIVSNSGTNTDAVFDFTIPKGDKGDAATVKVGNVSTGAPGSSASVINSGTTDAATLDFVIPQGAKGDAATISVGTVKTGAEKTAPVITNSGTPNDAIFDFTIPKGDSGKAATIAIGTISTGAPGSQASVVNVGTDTDAILNITLPAGIQGEKGDTGKDFSISKTFSSIAEMNNNKNSVAEGEFVIIASNTEDVDNSKLYVKTATDFKFLTDLSGAQGFKGETGDAATIAVGTITTLPPSAGATISNVGDQHNAIFDIAIPKGDKGDAATISVGTVKTSTDGIAKVTNAGDESNAVFNFDLPQGKAASVSIGTVNTGAVGTSAAVKNSGTSSDAIFDFTIPRGDTGKPFELLGSYSTLEQLTSAHPSGNIGDAYEVSGQLYMWSATENAWKNRGDWRGPKGDTGDNATISIGSVTSGSSSSVVNSGTEVNAVLDFVLEKGDKGDPFTYEDFTPEQIQELIAGVAESTDYATKNFVVNRRTTVSSSLEADAQHWNENSYTKLNSDYPIENYDIEVSLSGSATEAEKKAWYEAEFVGSIDSNYIVATKKPSVNIPIILTLFNRKI